MKKKLIALALILLGIVCFLLVRQINHSPKKIHVINAPKLMGDEITISFHAFNPPIPIEGSKILLEGKYPEWMIAHAKLAEPCYLSYDEYKKMTSEALRKTLHLDTQESFDVRMSMGRSIYEKRPKMKTTVLWGIEVFGIFGHYVFVVETHGIPSQTAPYLIDPKSVVFCPYKEIKDHRYELTIYEDLQEIGLDKVPYASLSKLEELMRANVVDASGFKMKPAVLKKP